MRYTPEALLEAVSVTPPLSTAMRAPGTGFPVSSTTLPLTVTAYAVPVVMKSAMTKAAIPRGSIRRVLASHTKDKVKPAQREERIRGPRGDIRSQITHVPHLFK